MARAKRYDGKNLCKPVGQLAAHKTLTAKQKSIAFRESLGYSLPAPSGTKPRAIVQYDCTEAIERCYADGGWDSVLLRWSWHPAIVGFWHRHKFELPGHPLPVERGRGEEEAAFFDRLSAADDDDDDYSDF